MKKTFLTLFLLIISTTCFAVQGEDWKLYNANGHKGELWNSLVESGLISFESENLHTAFIFLQRAADKGCIDGLVLYKLAVYHESLQNYKQALDLYTKAKPYLSKHYPKHDHTKKIDESIGRTLFMLNDYTNAQVHLEKALKTDPNNFALLFMTGQILRMQTDYKGAIDRFDKALHSPKSVETGRDLDKLILIELMKSYYEVGEYDKALATSNNVLMIEPGNPIAVSYAQEIQKTKEKEDRMKKMQKMVQ